MRNILDVHAALGAGDDHRRLRLAVEHDGEIKFARRVLRHRDHHFAHQLAVRAGLRGDQRLAEHLAGELLDFLRRFHQLHAALEAVLERALAASAGVDLRLDHEVGRLERRARRPPLLPACWRPRRGALRRQISASVLLPGTRECSLRKVLQGVKVRQDALDLNKRTDRFLRISYVARRIMRVIDFLPEIAAKASLPEICEVQIRFFSAGSIAFGRGVSLSSP